MLNPSPSVSPNVYPSLEGLTYDWPIWEAVRHVRNVIGDEDAANCYPKTRIAIRQATADRRLSVFGRQELPLPKKPGFHSDIWTLIEPEYWQAHAINSLATDEEWHTHDHTQPEPLFIGGYRERYWSLLVNRDEIVSAFAQLQPSHDDAVRDYPGGPTWVDLACDPHFADQLGEREHGPTRAPSVKTGSPPSDEDILAKANEMKDRGLDGRTIAKQMRLEEGFANVANTTVRDLIKGLWRGGRPKKPA